MKTIFDLSITEKENNLLYLIDTLSINIIGDIDNAIKLNIPKNEEYPLIDMIVESFFSIHSFCLLLKDGLISSASAILRILLEQVSITHILVHNIKARKRFLEIKKEMRKYYKCDKEEMQAFNKTICEREGIQARKIKQYFDYGWFKEANCKNMDIKSICDVAGTSGIYKIVDVMLNAFSHGQMSIFQLKRNRNGVDVRFRRSIIRSLFGLFFLDVTSVSKEFGSQSISDKNNKTISVARSLYIEIVSRIAEESYLEMQEKADFTELNLHDYYSAIETICYLLSGAQDRRELYLLSQAYYRLSKIVIVASIQTSEGIKDVRGLGLRKLFSVYKTKIKYTGTIPLDTLLEILDTIDNKWTLGDSLIDYAFIESTNELIQSTKRY